MSRRSLVLKLRGLPWSCCDEDINEFFGSSRAIAKITLTKNRDGRPSGEAFVAFNTEDDLERGLKKNKCSMGKRYIEVFAASTNDIEYNITGPERRLHSGISLPGRDTSILKCRGLPYGCTSDEIVRFFSPIEIAENGIVQPYDLRSGRATGQAFVAFYDTQTADRALERNRSNIQHRYIEVFRSTYGEMLHALEPEEDNRGSRSTPYDRLESRVFERSDRRPRRNDFWGDSDGWYSRMGGGGLMRRGSIRDERRSMRNSPPPSRRGGRMRNEGYLVKMRGLPYRATEHDIEDFFDPVRPESIEMPTEYGTGRPSGEAIVEFASVRDRDEAMRKDRKHMGSRYIELFAEV